MLLLSFGLSYKQWLNVSFRWLGLSYLFFCASWSFAAGTEEVVAVQMQIENTAQLAQHQPSALSDPQLMALDIRRIQERGHLIVAKLESDCEPFVIKGNDGQLSGLSVDLLEGFAGSIGVDLVYNSSSETYNGLVEQVALGQVDVAACGVSRTMHRAMYVNFTQPYIRLHQGLLANRVMLSRQTDGHSWGAVIKKLKGRVGVLTGSSYVQFAEKYFQGMEIVLFPSVTDAQEAVISGDIIAAHLDELDIKRIIRNQPEHALLCQTVLFKDILDYLSIPVSWQNRQLLSLLNIYIEEHPINLTIDQILDLYSQGNTAKESGKQ